MNYALALIMIGFYAGVLAIPLTKYLVNRNTERDEDIVPDGMPRVFTKKPRKIKRRRISLKPSMRKGGAA